MSVTTTITVNCDCCGDEMGQRQGLALPVGWPRDGGALMSCQLIAPVGTDRHTGEVVDLCRDCRLAVREALLQRVRPTPLS